MTDRRHLLAAGALAILSIAAPVFGHHSWPVDMSRAVTVKGTVTGYDWGNPHVMIALDVPTAGGAMEKWSVGGPSTSRMGANGWDKSTLKPGDVITAIGYRFSDGQRILRLDKVVMASGKEMLLYGR